MANRAPRPTTTPYPAARDVIVNYTADDYGEPRNAHHLESEEGLWQLLTYLRRCVRVIMRVTELGILRDIIVTNI